MESVSCSQEILAVMWNITVSTMKLVQNYGDGSILVINWNYSFIKLQTTTNHNI